MPLRIGASEADYGPANYLFPGKIDELRVYQSALSQNEIRAEMCKKYQKVRRILPHIIDLMNLQVQL